MGKGRVFATGFVSPSPKRFFFITPVVHVFTAYYFQYLSLEKNRWSRYRGKNMCKQQHAINEKKTFP